MMDPRRCPARSSTGFHGVRAWPSSFFAAEICAANQHCWLGTFNSLEEAARAYDAAAWRFGWPRRDLNFPDIPTRADAEMLAPPPWIATQVEQCCYERVQL
ncbi:hypothetical protein ACQ4PT_050960 [Festuca glaucescens]